MTTEYEALIATDVPHYGVIEYSAHNDDEAITRVKSEAHDAHSDPEWDNAHSLRIVYIENQTTGETFAEDLELGGPMAHLLSEDEDRLFRAGPDLLAALIECVQDLQDWASDHEEPGEPFIATERALKQARAAIAKAKP